MQNINIDSLANISQIVEAFILIASVFYLSLQVKQANKLSKSETRRTMLKMDLADLAVGRDNPAIIRLWTKEELMERGESFYAINCSACHQANGKGSKTVYAPNLVGFSDTYMFNQLVKYRDGIRL